ncbi:MAG: DUF6404 family protein [Candidatus Delongbacteria bacterium]
MTHAEKVEHFRRDLESRGLNPASAAPPMCRLAWRIGWNLRPPQFLSFRHWFLSSGGYFAAFMFAFPWLVRGPLIQGGVLQVALQALLAGVLFGLTMAFINRRKARNLHLPTWENYPD